MRSGLRKLIYMVAHGLTVIGAAMFALLFYGTIGEPPTDLHNLQISWEACPRLWGLLLWGFFS
jgi:hypothetical protein